MTDYLPALINLRYPVTLPWHRVEFHARRPRWEAGRLEHMHQHVQPGMVVWDIGAECGDFTALYRTWVGDDGAVVPIEPMPAMWPDIVGTWEANDLPHPPWTFEGFVGDFTSDNAHERLRLAGDAEAAWPWASVGDIVPDPGFMHLAHHTDMVETATIDWLVDHVGRFPDVLVLDIEGAELRAMRGAEGLLSLHHVPLVYISVHPPTMADWYGDTPDELHAFMRGHGYTETWLHNDGGEDCYVYEAR